MFDEPVLLGAVPLDAHHALWPAWKRASAVTVRSQCIGTGCIAELQPLHGSFVTSWPLLAAIEGRQLVQGRRAGRDDRETGVSLRTAVVKKRTEIYIR